MASAATPKGVLPLATIHQLRSQKKTRYNMIIHTHALHRLFWIVRSTAQRHPTLVNSASGFILFTASDFAAQFIEQSHPNSHTFTRQDWNDKFFVLDFRRSLGTGVLGIFFSGFMYPRAYAILDRLWPLSSMRHVLTKSLTEIGTVGVFMNATSLSARGILVGRSWRDEVASHVAQEMPRVTLNDVKVWLPYNTIAFAFIPAYIRPTTTAMVNASWQTYISLRSHDYSTKALSSVLPHASCKGNTDFSYT
jgi:hypothetical protein